MRRLAVTPPPPRHAQERRTLTEQVNTLQEQLQCANDDVKTHAEAAGAAHNALESLQKEMHQTEQAASQTAAQLRAALDTKEEELAQCSAQCASLQEALEAVQVFFFECFQCREICSAYDGELSCSMASYTRHVHSCV